MQIHENQETTLLASTHKETEPNNISIDQADAEAKLKERKKMFKAFFKDLEKQYAAYSKIGKSLSFTKICNEEFMENKDIGELMNAIKYKSDQTYKLRYYEEH
jgi:predicted lipase